MIFLRLDTITRSLRWMTWSENTPGRTVISPILKNPWNASMNMAAIYIAVLIFQELQPSMPEPAGDR